MSGSPFSTFFSEIFRFANFPITISCNAPILNLSSAVSLISFFSKTISAFDPLKSKRFANSFFAWLTAFSISIEFTSLTMSYDGMRKRLQKKTKETKNFVFDLCSLRYLLCARDDREDPHQHARPARARALSPHEMAIRATAAGHFRR